MIAAIPRPKKRGRPKNYQPVGYAAALPDSRRSDIRSGLANHIATCVFKRDSTTNLIFTGKVTGVSRGNIFNSYIDTVTITFPQQHDDIEEFMETWNIDELK
jgi:hypothetical protein